MYAGNLLPSRDPKKGYASTYAGYVEANKKSASNLLGGPVDVSSDGYAVAAQLWEDVSATIASSSKLIKPLLYCIGVEEADMSPFCRSFSSLKDLRDEFIKYSPSTFSYDRANGAGEDDVAEQDGTPGDCANDDAIID